MEVSGFIPWIYSDVFAAFFPQSFGASFDAAFRIALARAAGNAGGHALAIPERFGGGGPRVRKPKWDHEMGPILGGKSNNAKLKYMVILRDFTYEWTLIHGIDILACIKNHKTQLFMYNLPFPWIIWVLNSFLNNAQSVFMEIARNGSEKLMGSHIWR